MKEFLKLVISATSPESSKRFVVVATIIMYLFICLISTIIFFMVTTKLFTAPPSTVSLFYDFYNTLLKSVVLIVLVGVGFITISNGFDAMQTVFSKKADAAIEAARNKVPETKVDVAEVHTQNVGK
jgi:hypothetical protein